MKMTSLLAAAAVALAAQAGAVTSAGAAEPAYQCTGVGLESRQAADSVPHNLKIEFAQADGHYLGGVATTISQGGTTVISVTCPGPWLLADLPSGSYHIEATLNGKTKSHNVSVGGTKVARAVIVF